MLKSTEAMEVEWVLSLGVWYKLGFDEVKKAKQEDMDL